jgi:hypothetical protein
MGKVSLADEGKQLMGGDSDLDLCGGGGKRVSRPRAMLFGSDARQPILQVSFACAIQPTEKHSSSTGIVGPDQLCIAVDRIPGARQEEVNGDLVDRG